MPRAKNWSAVILVVLSLSLQYADPVFAAAPQKVVRLKVGYASITGGRIPLWAAHDMEFLRATVWKRSSSSSPAPHTGYRRCSQERSLFTRALPRPELKPPRRALM